jgi:serine/threonine-protein kinase
MIKPDKGVVIAKRYALVRPLAQGGMGSVWIARHLDLDVDVTVKFMAPTLIASADARARFEREARVAARLESQHVVHVQDYGVEDGTPYLVMELLKGESLWARLAREGTMPLDAAARLLQQMCKALRTAHEAGLVHRDLKPGNVFLARKDEDDVVKILDFGLAKANDLGEAQANTESGVLLGSVHYMSPEQIRSSRSVDQRSDLWSIGVILYRVLGGRLPFPGEKLGDVLVRVCTDPFPRLTMLVPDLPPGVDAFFERALDRDPDKRFQSAGEMSEAFAALVQEATAPPAPVPPRPAEPSWLTAQLPPGGRGYTVALAPAEPPPTPAPPPPPAQPLPAAIPPAPHVPAAATAPYVPIAPPTPFARPIAPPEPASQITALNVSSPPRRPSRAPIVAALVVPISLAAIGGAVAILRSSSPGAGPAAAPAASAQPSPPPPPASAPAPGDPAPPAPATSAQPEPAAPEAPATAPSSSATSSRPAARPPARRAGCNPPYRLDARGIRVPKMECL